MRSKKEPRATKPTRIEPVTARPHPTTDDVAREEQDIGLSIDPEDMGEWALRSAMQEDVAHSRQRSEPLSMVNAYLAATVRLSDEASVEWDELSEGDAELDAAEDAVAVDPGEPHKSRVIAKPGHNQLDIDFRQGRIVEASLLDMPTADGTDTIEPVIHDDANESHLTPSHREAEHEAQDRSRTAATRRTQHAASRSRARPRGARRRSQRALSPRSSKTPRPHSKARSQ